MAAGCVRKPQALRVKTHRAYQDGTPATMSLSGVDPRREGTGEAYGALGSTGEA